ncbi:hydrogenase expression/formation protein HypE [Campylobacterota bacterium]|nr:hydrogenase expression/formation protein HypE [Campylobacterota bacterium]
MKNITLAHGGGALETRELIDAVFAKKLSNQLLDRAEDAAVIEPAKLAVSIDSFVVKPIFFSGGDIGKLAVAGSCNDVAMMGAKPRYIAASFILEEGLSFAALETIVDSFAAELAVNGAIVISADTKVVQKGAADGGLYISTTALGEVVLGGLDVGAIAEGDLVLASGSCGDHGAAIFAAREGIEIGGLKSDCASLWGLVAALIEAKLPIVTMRDATRGGLAAICNEWAIASRHSIELDQSAIAVKQEVQGACELLGFEPYALANEGMMALVVRGRAAADEAVKIMRENPLGRGAGVIGRVLASSVSGGISGGLAAVGSAAVGSATAGARSPRVTLKTPHGTTRLLEMPSGELLPRIC